MNIRTVSIRPGVSVLSVLRHLNYQPWFALAEFVDNALQSYMVSGAPLREIHGDHYRLRVTIELRDDNSLVVRDNAAGIATADYERAFRPAAIPPDRHGLSEFGMGMKSAACWFAPRWRVRTSALGETVMRTVEFDIDHIVKDDISELTIREEPAPTNEHFTEISLIDLHHRPAGRTIGKIKDHLTDIYRVFVRNGELDLRLGPTSLIYESPAILRAPHFKDMSGPALEWRKAIDFDFGAGLQVQGFVAIRERANVAKAGLALFRRGRLIQGSADDGYRPPHIFGGSNSYRYQRVFGELHLEGFDVSHTKDGFRWDENEQPFLELLRDQIDSDELPLLRQAEGYRVRSNRDQLVGAADKAVGSASDALASHLGQALDHIDQSPRDDKGPPEALPAPADELAKRGINVRFRGEPWSISLELTNDPAAKDFVEISDRPSALDKGPRTLGIRVSLAHPFMVRFAGTDSAAIDAILRLAAAMAVSEVVTREAGYKGATIFLQNANDLIGEALSEP